VSRRRYPPPFPRWLALGLVAILAGLVVLAVVDKGTGQALGGPGRHTARAQAAGVVTRGPAGVPEPRARRWTPARLERLVLDAFPLRAQATAWCIVRREDPPLNPRVHNWRDHHSDGSRGSHGLFQIGSLWRHHGETVAHFARRMENPVANVTLARELWLRSGWAPWGGGC